MSTANLFSALYGVGAPAPASPSRAPVPAPACDILVQVDNFEAGGLENVVIDVNGTLAEAGYRVVLLVLGRQGSAVQRAREEGQLVVCQGYTAESYAELLDRLRPTLVLAHYSFKGVELSGSRGIPFVQVIHNVYVWFGEGERRAFAGHAKGVTAFVAVSDYVKAYSVSRLGVPAEKCVVIPNGIDFAPFESLDIGAARGRLRARFGIAPDDFVFLDVGAISIQKNHLGVVKAFEIAIKSCPNAKLVILGPVHETYLLDELLASIDVAWLGSRVVYAGSAPGAHEYLAMADAFVAGAHFEGCQLTLLEALRANIPVVSTRVGIAACFRGHQGVEVIEPASDLMLDDGEALALKSNSDFEARLADAMVRTWRNPIRPDLTAGELALLDRKVAYERYVFFLAGLSVFAEQVKGLPIEPDSHAARLVRELSDRMVQIESLKQSAEQCESRAQDLVQRLADSEARLSELFSSTSWRITRPLRAVSMMFQAIIDRDARR